jgi:23S rRNA pseudouridine1911/1915/1917 synthase
MSVVEGGGKVAITRFELQQTIGNFSLVEVELQTGRTHQIRVHMSHIGHGLVGDKTYKSVVNWKFVNPKLKKLTQSFPRQALHAWKLSVPQRNGEYIEVKSDLPDDIAELISEMKEINGD